MQNWLCQLTLNWVTETGDPMANVFYVRNRDCGGSPGNKAFTNGWADTMAGQLISAFQTSGVLALLSQDVGIESCSWVWNENVPDGPLHEGIHVPSGAPLAGGETGAVLPLGIAKAVRLQTGLGGRHYHGRFFLGGFPTSALNPADGDVFSNTYFGLLSTAVGSLLSNVNHNDCVSGVGDSASLEVVAFYHGGALLNPPIANDVTVINMRDQNVDYQRRRSLGHGRHH